MLLLTMTSLTIAAPVVGLDAPSHASVRVSWRLSMVKEMGTMSQCGLLRLSSMMGILRCGLWWCDGSRNLIRNYLTSSIGCWLPVVVLTIFGSDVRRPAIVRRVRETPVLMYAGVARTELNRRCRCASLRPGARYRCRLVRDHRFHLHLH
jgi:hypothetical protein